jgi:hypothetical protein
MYNGRCTQPIDQTGILVGIVTQESAPCCDLPRIAVHVLGVQVICHEDGKTATKVDRSEAIRGREGDW